MLDALLQLPRAGFLLLQCGLQMFNFLFMQRLHLLAISQLPVPGVQFLAQGSIKKSVKSWRDEALAAKWAMVRRARRAVTAALEVQRTDKVIGASLEAADCKGSTPLFYAAETWTPPVICNGLLYVCQNNRGRGDGSPRRLLCYDVRGE